MQRTVPRHSQRRTAALSEAERDALEKNYYRQLEHWLSEPVDPGFPEPPTALMRPTRRKKKR